MKRGREHVDVVDYLRGMAAVMVTWFHLTNGYGATWPAYTGCYGWLGVELFFVISGFVITLSLSTHDGPRRVTSYLEFMTKRIVRLEPPYIASILLSLALLFISSHVPGFQGQQPSFYLPQLLFHLAYLIPFTSYEWLQPVYWTLTYEFFFYLIGGIVIPLIMRPQRTLTFVGAALAVIVAGWLDIMPLLVLLFIIGIAACRVHLRRGAVWVNVVVAISAATTMALKGMGVEAGSGLFCGALLAGNHMLPSPPPQLGRVLTGFGTISYSLYLIHVPVGGRIVNLGGRWLHTPIEHFGLSIVAFAVSCLFATAFWWGIERPSMAAAARYARRVRKR